MKTNMIIVEDFDGLRFEAATAQEVVAAMRAKSWSGKESDGNKGFMKQIAKRVQEWNGSLVRINSAENFLDDMERAGQLRVTKPGEQ